MAARGVGLGDLCSERGQTCRQISKGDARDRAVNQSWPVRIHGEPVRGFADGLWIRPGAATLGACDKKILAGSGDNGGIPLRRNEAGGWGRLASSEFGEIKDGDGIGNGVGGEECLLVGTECEIFR